MDVWKGKVLRGVVFDLGVGSTNGVVQAYDYNGDGVI